MGERLHLGQLLVGDALNLRHVEDVIVAEQHATTGLLGFGLLVLERLPENDGQTLLALADVPAQRLGLAVGQIDGRFERGKLEEKLIDSAIGAAVDASGRSCVSPGLAPWGGSRLKGGDDFLGDGFVGVGLVRGHGLGSFWVAFHRSRIGRSVELVLMFTLGGVA